MRRTHLRRTCSSGAWLVLCFLFLLRGLSSCDFAPERELVAYDPSRTCDGVTLFGIMKQTVGFRSTHAYLNAIPMVSRTPLPSRIEPLWEYSDPEGGLVHDVKLLPDQDILAIMGAYGGALVAIDPRTSERVWRYDAVHVHHDALLLPDGSFLFLYLLAGTVDPVYGEIVHDGLRVVDRQGNTLWDWALLAHDPAGNLEHYLSCPPEVPVPLPYVDWSHCNGIAFVQDEGWTPGAPLGGAIYLSVRNWNRIYKISYPSGEVQWVLGDNGDFGHGLFSMAHGLDAATFSDAEGNRKTRLLLFDNGVCRAADGPCPADERPCPPDVEPYSRVLELLVEDEQAPSGPRVRITRKWPSPHAADFREHAFYVAQGGYAQWLPNGNILVTVSAEDGSMFDPADPVNGRLIEICPGPDAAGADVVWEVKLNEPYGTYRALRIPFEDWPL